MPGCSGSRRICWTGRWEVENHRFDEGLNFNPESLSLSNMDYRAIITIEPGKRSGKPCIRGLRITVQDVLEYLAGGMSVNEILEDFPELNRDDIQACLAFAADRERKLFTDAA